MFTNFMEENGFFDLDSLIPTSKEIEKTIKHITESRKLSFDDEIVLMKIKFIHKIIKNKR